MVSTGTLPQDIGTTFEKNFRSYLANPPPKNHFWHIRRAVDRDILIQSTGKSQDEHKQTYGCYAETIK